MHCVAVGASIIHWQSNDTFTFFYNFLGIRVNKTIVAYYDYYPDLDWGKPDWSLTYSWSYFYLAYKSGDQPALVQTDEMENIYVWK